LRAGVVQLLDRSEHAENAMSDSLIVARSTGQAQQLMLLFHGVGANAQDLVPLGHTLAAEFPDAFIVSVAAPYPFEGGGSGRQWFSVMGISEENRLERVEAAMPAFVETVARWQKEAGVGTDAVALIGFSQGAIMALECTRDRPAIAGRVVSIAGRFATLPETPNASTTLHMFHGKADPVIPYGFTVESAQHLIDIGADVTADVIPHVGHTITQDVANLVIERLRGHLPKRVWAAAMKAARESDSKE
jgi:phospholipase/carboxylesterase